MKFHNYPLKSNTELYLFLNYVFYIYSSIYGVTLHFNCELKRNKNTSTQTIKPHNMNSFFLLFIGVLFFIYSYLLYFLYYLYIFNIFMCI